MSTQQTKPDSELEAAWKKEIDKGRFQSDKVAREQYARRLIVDHKLKKANRR